MPIIALRDSPAYSTSFAPNGTPILDTTLNGFENLKSHLAGRGGYANTFTGSWVNGQFKPLVGVVGGLKNGVNAWEHGQAQVSYTIPLGGGIDTLQYLTTYRLRPNYVDPDAPSGFWGGSIRLEAVLNGNKSTFFYTNYRSIDTFQNPDMQDFSSGTVRLASLFKQPIDGQAMLSVLVTFSTVEEIEPLYGQLQGANQYSNPDLWQGIGNLGIAAFTDCEGC